jgi:hypothetical protein
VCVMQQQAVSRPLLGWPCQTRCGMQHHHHQLQQQQWLLGLEHVPLMATACSCCLCLTAHVVRSKPLAEAVPWALSIAAVAAAAWTGCSPYLRVPLHLPMQLCMGERPLWCPWTGHRAAAAGMQLSRQFRSMAAAVEGAVGEVEAGAGAGRAVQMLVT